MVFTASLLGARHGGEIVKATLQIPLLYDWARHFTWKTRDAPPLRGRQMAQTPRK